ncbi:MAG TPA: hypothetical protein DCR68_00710 [Coprothermobacter sp.]|jgi:hypothetical protein|nr:hypothetical protein [Coprothermobacter sp.]
MAHVMAVCGVSKTKTFHRYQNCVVFFNWKVTLALLEPLGKLQSVHPNERNCRIGNLHHTMQDKQTRNTTKE